MSEEANWRWWATWTAAMLWLPAMMTLGVVGGVYFINSNPALGALIMLAALAAGLLGLRGFRRALYILGGDADA